MTENEQQKKNGQVSTVRETKMDKEFSMDRNINSKTFSVVRGDRGKVR